MRNVRWLKDVKSLKGNYSVYSFIAFWHQRVFADVEFLFPKATMGIKGLNMDKFLNTGFVVFSQLMKNIFASLSFLAALILS